MADLIAQGPTTSDRWRREIPNPTSGHLIVIGRSEGDWNVPWDSMISRQHVRLNPLPDDRVEVSLVGEPRNAVFHRGRQTAKFTLVPGEHFAIGKTTFTLANRPGASDSSSAEDVTQHAFDHAVLRRRHFRDASSRIEVLSRLPDLIAGSGSDEELLVRVTSVMLQATPSASAVAIVSVDQEFIANNPDAVADIQVLHYDSRQPLASEPAVSARLIRDALAKRESTLYLWTGAHDAGFTALEGVDWSFCVPLRSEACPGWAIYVTGQMPLPPGGDSDASMQLAPETLQDDVKFAELVGTTIANLRQSRRLERRQAAMRRFFSPVVMDALATREINEVLEPRETNLTVMFCDLRGFTRRSEQDSGQLLILLAQVSDALGVMTNHILGTGGVIGDFHGDAAMGFWGWPLEQSDSALRAVEAASRIWQENSLLTAEDRFACGIGIATGRAVAGRIGTVDQVKVTAFGSVVNLASRLEGITKAFGADVILDDATAQQLLKNTQNPRNAFRLRRLATVKPAGMSRPVKISELMPAAEFVADRNQKPILSDMQISDYERGLDSMISGDWEEAIRRLEKVPEWDRPRSMLLSIIENHDFKPPASWQGIIEMPKL